MKKILLSLLIMGLSIFMVGNIYQTNKESTFIEYNNKIYLNGNYYNVATVNDILDSDIKVYEIADDIKPTNDTSNYIFIALLVGLTGFVITSIYLKHIN